MRSARDWYGNPILEVMLLDHDEPTNYEEAMVSPDSAKWLEAMKSEMGSMYENKVWTLIDLPIDRRAIEIKWIFKRNTDADSSVTIYKARLVEKGFQPNKLEPKSEKCVFIEYPKETVGYTFYQRSQGKIFIAKNGSFLEKEFLSK